MNKSEVKAIVVIYFECLYLARKLSVRFTIKTLQWVTQNSKPTKKQNYLT